MAETKERSITEIPEELIKSATEHLWQFTGKRPGIPILA